MLSHFTFHIVCSRRIDPVDTNPGRKSAWRVLLLISYVIAVCVLQVGIFMPARGSSFFIGQLCQRSQYCGRWQYRYERSVRSDPIHRIRARLHHLVSGFGREPAHPVGPGSVLAYRLYFLRPYDLRRMPGLYTSRLAADPCAWVPRNLAPTIYRYIFDQKLHDCEKKFSPRRAITRSAPQCRGVSGMHPGSA